MTPRPVPVSDVTVAGSRAAVHAVVARERAIARMTAIARGLGLTDTRAALIEWRAVDRTHPADTAEWWEATLRLRDIADRAERETRA